MIFVHTSICAWCMYMHINRMLYVCECVAYNCVQRIHFLVIKLTIAMHSYFMTF